jgi:thymidylate synthase (FAD)
MKVVDQSVELLWSTPDPEIVIERSGRVCYMSESPLTSDSAKKFISKIINNQHLSVLEHASASFKIVTDRAIGNEVVRHRIASYSQTSTRYVDYVKGNDIEFIQPSGMTKEVFHVWRGSIVEAEARYFSMRAEGASPQIARSVLPLCTATTIIMTCNFREWMHFIELRTASTAHPEIREVANMILNKLVKISPSCFGHFLKD